MKTYLVTGAAGFIGANFIKHMLAKYDDIKIVVLDLLTYAGNLGTIAEDIDGVRCEFVKGDICDRALADQLFEKYNFDYVVNFAAESHVDRSIENPQLFLQTNNRADSLPIQRIHIPLYCGQPHAFGNLQKPVAVISERRAEKLDLFSRQVGDFFHAA